ncbi:MAG: hypothetical protein K9G26_08335 [Emcibacter sp.]|nr:hypothetical protein [Emcibacter sp.]
MTFECTKLNIFSSLQQAYRCLWQYKTQHVMISLTAALPFCLAGFLGYLDPLLSLSHKEGTMPEGFNLAFIIFILTTFIWIIPVIILWHRLYLLGPEHLFRKKIWPLITRTLRVLAKSLIFLGIGFIAAATITAAILYLRIMSESADMKGTITEMGHSEYVLYVVGLLVLLTFLMVVALRLSMAFSALSIGKTLGFTTSWRITRKNTFRMLIATLLGIIPLLGINIFILWAIKYFFFVDILSGTAENITLIYIFVLLFSPILSLPIALLCSLTTRFYRHCGCEMLKK